MSDNTLYTFALWLLPVLFSITLHEVAHGWAAYALGDKTAFFLGRLSLNPLKHLDFVGTIIVPCILLATGGFLFGWAKPVPVQKNNLHHPKSGMAFVALAGPFSNLLMALSWATLAKFSTLISSVLFLNPSILVEMGLVGIQINLLLGILNLLPIPPLDGSHLLAALLPRHAEKYLNTIAPYGFFILLILMIFDVLNLLLFPIIQWTYHIILTAFNLV